MKKVYTILIVIGALMMSCVNSDVTNKELENEILQSLKLDLIQNLEDINSNINSLEISEQANRMIIDHFENKRPYQDSLDYHFANLYPYLVFSPNESTFNYIKQIGLSVISNDSIRTSISDLYGVQYGIYKDYERIYFVEHYTNYIKPMFIAEFETFQFYRSFKPRAYDQFANNIDYRRVMSYTADASQTFMFMQYGLKEKVEQLISQINNETN